MITFSYILTRFDYISVNGNAKYDPEEIQEPVYETRWQGVDCYPALVGFRPVKKDRWSRTCKKCGKVEYATKKVVLEFNLY